MLPWYPREMKLSRTVMLLVVLPVCSLAT